MKNDSGNLSIDFLAGFTIFMLAFIWVATMIPGLLVGITGHAIDYDAVAYRTGVILTEDPGMPADPPWENLPDDRNEEVQRMGFALTKESPTLLSLNKITRFFSSGFTYPDDYQEKIIFGDHPYRFNISVMTFDSAISQAAGDIRPSGGYGYIRRFVLVKEMSNATVDAVNARSGSPSDTHLFSVSLNMTRLLNDERQPAYMIDPMSEPVTIDMTNLSGSLVFDKTTPIQLQTVTLYSWKPPDGPSPVPFNFSDVLYIDGQPAPVPMAPTIVKTNVSLVFPPGSLSGIPSVRSITLLVNFTYTLTNPDPMNTEWTGDYFINSTDPAVRLSNFDSAFDYDYNPSRVTQPRLAPGIVEVAVW